MSNKVFSEPTQQAETQLNTQDFDIAKILGITITATKPKKMSLRTEIKDFIKEFEEGFEEEEFFAPKLYHYTDLTALKGIVESKKLWATHINFLNDKSERKYAHEKVAPIIRELFQNKNENYEKILEYFEKKIPFVTSSDLYITSFSKEPDSLSQWRGYGKKYDSVCIGFNTEKFIPDLGERALCLLNKIEYCEEKQEEYIRDYLSGICNILERCPNEKMEEELRNNLLFVLFRYLAKMKHPSWEEEAEYRLIYALGRHRSGVARKIEPEFRVGKANLIPYIPVNPFKNEDFENGIFKIILPQSENYENSKMAIEKLLDKHGFKDVCIEKSKIPIAY